MPVIVIDAGHGGFDGGSTACDGTLEKDLNLWMADDLSAVCRIFGYTVVQTRVDDTTLEEDPSASIHDRKISDMKKRLEMMTLNHPEAYISIHMNHFSSPSVHGTQMFYSPGYEQAKTIAFAIKKRLTEINPANDRAVKAGGADTYLLKNASCPAVLAECGFISNREDLEHIQDDQYRKKLALGIFIGLLDGFSENDKNAVQAE